MAKSKKNKYFLIVILISIILVYLYRIILTGIIGAKGVTYFSVSSEVFMLIACSFGYGLEQGVSFLAESYVSRQQYENSKRVLNAGMILALILGLVFLFILMCFGKKITVDIFNVPLSFMPYMIMCLAVPFYIISGAVRGYLNGNENHSVVEVSYIIFAASYIVSGSLFSTLFLKYGEQVSLLLRVENYKYAYGAMGASLGFLVASLISFTHILIVCMIFRRRTVFNSGRDYSKSIESMLNLIVAVLTNSLFSIAFVFFVVFVPFINEILILSKNGEDTSLEFTFGEWYGKAEPILVITACVLGFFIYKSARRSVAAMLRGENTKARENLGIMIHRSVTIGFFVSGMILVFADNILSILFRDNGEKTAVYLQVGAVLIFLILFSDLFIYILIRSSYGNLSSVIFTASSIIHAALAFVFIKISGLSIIGAIIGNLLFFLIISVVGYFIVARFFQYSQEWFRSFGVSVISSLVSALIIMLLNGALLKFVTKGVAIMILLPLGIILYMVFLLALKGYSEEELSNSIMGRITIFIGRLFRLL